MVILARLMAWLLLCNRSGLNNAVNMSQAHGKSRGGFFWSHVDRVVD
jgi:hypothetical protein